MIPTLAVDESVERMNPCHVTRVVGVLPFARAGTAETQRHPVRPAFEVNEDRQCRAPLRWRGLGIYLAGRMLPGALGRAPSTHLPERRVARGDALLPQLQVD